DTVDHRMAVDQIAKTKCPQSRDAHRLWRFSGVPGLLPAVPLPVAPLHRQRIAQISGPGGDPRGLFPAFGVAHSAGIWSGDPRAADDLPRPQEAMGPPQAAGAGDLSDLALRICDRSYNLFSSLSLVRLFIMRGG